MIYPCPDLQVVLSLYPLKGCCGTCRAVAYEPPSEELTEALIVLARYVTTTEHPGSREQPFRPAQVLPWLPVPPAQPALTAWSPGASCAPTSLGPAGEPAAQAGI